jgi:hypothetical protein
MKKKECSGMGKIKGIIFISKYMIKRWGVTEALNRTIKRKQSKKRFILAQ